MVKRGTTCFRYLNETDHRLCTCSNLTACAGQLGAASTASSTTYLAVRRNISTVIRRQVRSLIEPIERLRRQHDKP